MGKYKCYRIRNTTKNQYEEMWKDSTDAVPTASVENPGDTIDTALTVITAEVDALTNPGDSSLDAQKAIRHEEIFLRTNELLVTGYFTYDGKNFRLSDRALVRWVGVGVADLKALLTFPYTVTTMEYVAYDIASAQEFTNFFGTGLLQAETIEAGGRALHQSINAAVDQAALDLVVDNR